MNFSSFSIETLLNLHEVIGINMLQNRGRRLKFEIRLLKWSKVCLKQPQVTHLMWKTIQFSSAFEFDSIKHCFDFISWCDFDVNICKKKKKENSKQQWWIVSLISYNSATHFTSKVGCSERDWKTESWYVAEEK